MQEKGTTMLNSNQESETNVVTSTTEMTSNDSEDKCKMKKMSNIQEASDGSESESDIYSKMKEKKLEQYFSVTLLNEKKLKVPAGEGNGRQHTETDCSDKNGKIGKEHTPPKVKKSRKRLEDSGGSESASDIDSKMKPKKLEQYFSVTLVNEKKLKVLAGEEHGRQHKETNYTDRDGRIGKEKNIDQEKIVEQMKSKTISSKFRMTSDDVNKRKVQSRLTQESQKSAGGVKNTFDDIRTKINPSITCGESLRPDWKPSTNRHILEDKVIEVIESDSHDGTQTSKQTDTIEQSIRHIRKSLKKRIYNKSLNSPLTETPKVTPLIAQNVPEKHDQYLSPKPDLSSVLASSQFVGKHLKTSNAASQNLISTVTPRKHHINPMIPDSRPSTTSEDKVMQVKESNAQTSKATATTFDTTRTMDNGKAERDPRKIISNVDTLVQKNSRNDSLMVIDVNTPTTSQQEEQNLQADATDRSPRLVLGKGKPRAPRKKKQSSKNLMSKAELHKIVQDAAKATGCWVPDDLPSAKGASNVEDFSSQPTGTGA